jgi:hypothetical protein
VALRIRGALAGLALAAAAVAADAPPGRALLVGCSRYPALAGRYQLSGPENDVRLLATLLKDRFEFSDGNITTLTGWPEDPARRPTRANVLGGLAKLASQARPDQQVLVYLAGHGSQQPSVSGEADGLDEVFLAADAGPWDDGAKHLPGAITDDQLGEALAAIRAAGARVTVLVDACHAGTATRGAPPAALRWRSVPVAELLGEAGQAALAAARAAAGEGSSGPEGLAPGPDDDGFVALGAAQAREKAAELPLPADGEEFHGLFTYELCRVLAASTSPLTYRELAERVTTRLRSQGFAIQTPHIEGAGLDRFVLGRDAPRRHQVLVGEPAGPRAVVLRGGTLHGLSPGSVLAVLPPAGAPEGDQPRGHVEVTHAGPVASVAAPVDHDGVPAPALDSLEPGSRARLVHADYGALELLVALQSRPDPALPEVTHPTGEGPAPMEELLAAIQGETRGRIRRDPTGTRASWFLRTRGDRVELIPREGVMPLEGVAGTGAVEVGSLATEDTRVDLARRTRVMLTKITKVANLLRVAGAQAEAGGTVGDGLDVEVEVLRYPGGWDADPEVVAFATGGRRIREGERVGYRIHNRGAEDADVTLLYVDASYGVTSLFPAAGEDNSVPAGSSRVVGQGTMTADPAGTEHLVALAVRSTGARQDFAYLAQERLEATRAASGSPLAQLLEAAAFGRGTTRGAPSGDGSRGHDASLVSWRTLPPAQAPEPEPARRDADLPVATEADLGGTSGHAVGTSALLRALTPEPRETWEDPRVAPPPGQDRATWDRVAGAVVVVRVATGFVTGFRVEEANLILTSASVVSGLEYSPDHRGFVAAVHQLGHGERARAEPDHAVLLAHDPVAGLALLRLIGDPVDAPPPLRLADAPPRLDDPCLLVGHQDRGALWSTRRGRVVALGESPDHFAARVERLLLGPGAPPGLVRGALEALPPTRLVLTDHATGPADAGGPLLAEDGRVIGMALARPGGGDPGDAAHAHLRELQRFLREVPDQPEFRVPSPWDLGTRFVFVDYDEDPRGIPEVLVAGAPGEPRQFFFDLDGDGFPSGVPTTAEGLAAVVRDRAWDWEVAVHRRRRGSLVFYAPGDAGDLRYIAWDVDGDGTTDLVYRRTLQGSWRIDRPTDPPEVTTPGHLPAGAMRRRWKALRTLLDP